MTQYKNGTKRVTNAILAERIAVMDKKLDDFINFYHNQHDKKEQQLIVSDQRREVQISSQDARLRAVETSQSKLIGLLIGSGALGGTIGSLIPLLFK
jgi:hypothetical protein